MDGHRFQPINRTNHRWVPAAAILILWLVAAGVAFADDALRAAANEVARLGDRASPRARALIISRHREFQRLGLNSRTGIPGEVFDRCQTWYVDTMTAIAKEEGFRMGIKVDLQLPPKQEAGKRLFQGGADLDLLTNATTPEDIQALQDAMNRRITAEVREGIPDAPAQGGWLKSNDIDVMADPLRTTEENFKKICDMNNFAYERRGAARFEAWKRDLAKNPKTAGALSFDDLSEYLDEMQSASARRGEQIGRIKGDLQSAVDDLASLKKSNAPADAVEEAARKVSALEDDLLIAQAQQAKMVERINDATDTVLKQYPLKPDPKKAKAAKGTGFHIEYEGGVVRGSDVTKHGKIRNTADFAHSPGLANQLNEEMLEDAYKRNAEALAAIAKDHPEAAEQCAAQIRRSAKNLTPKQKAELFEHIRATQDDKVANAIKAAIFDQAPPEGMTSLGGKSSGAYTIRSTSSTVREAGGEFAEAMAKGRYGDAMDALENMQQNLKKARDLASMPGGAANTGLETVVNEYGRIKAAAAKLPPSQQAAFIEAEVKKLLGPGGAGGNLSSAVRTATREAELLGMMAGERDGMRRAVIREILEGKPGRAQELWEKLVGFTQKYPVEYVFNAVFAFWDAMAAAKLDQEGKYEEASRKAIEGLAGAFGSPVTAVIVVIGNLVLDAAKDAGYSIAVNEQDMDDLLAGIVSVKGWESAEGFPPGLETSVQQLALTFTNQEEIKKYLKDAIDAASMQGIDSPEVRESKKKALYDRMVDRLLAAWRARREQFVMDYLDLLPSLDNLMAEVRPRIEIEPDPLLLLGRRDGSKSARGTLRIKLDGPLADLRAVASDLDARLRKLGGSDNLLAFYFEQRIAWSIDGASQPMENTIGLSPVLLEKPVEFTEAGKHTIQCKAEWELKPISVITENPDFRGKRFALSPIRSIRWHPDTGWKIDWRWEIDTSRASSGFAQASVLPTDGGIARLASSLKFNAIEDTFTPGDVVERHAAQMKRTFSASGERAIEVLDTGEDDRIEVRIRHRSPVLAGETVVLTPRFVCAEPVDTTGYVYDWKGPVRGKGDTAFFQPAKPGTYTVGLTARSSGVGMIGAMLALAKGGFAPPATEDTVLEAEPVSIEVLPPEAAEFSFLIDGPSRVAVGADLRLRARVGGNLVAQKVFDDPDVWIEWHVNGQLFDTGESVFTEAVVPGLYEFEARIVSHASAGDRVLESKRHTVEAVAGEPPSTGEPPSMPPSTPGGEPPPEVAGPGGRPPEPMGPAGGTGGGKQPGGEPKPPAGGTPPSGPAVVPGGPPGIGGSGGTTVAQGPAAGGTGGRSVMAGAPGGDVYYGQTVAIGFGRPAGIPAGGVSAADQAFFDALAKGSKEFEQSMEERRKKQLADAQRAIAEAEKEKKEWLSKTYENMTGQMNKQGGRTEPSPPPGLSDVEREAWLRAKAYEEMQKIANPGGGLPSSKDGSWPTGDPGPPSKPSGKFVLGDDPPDSGRPATGESKTVATSSPPPVAGTLRYVYQASPNVAFDPPESADGRTRVTFDRVGRVLIWAEVYTNAAGPPIETAQATYRVKAPALSIACWPASGGKVGEEVRARVTASPAIPENLVNYVWLGPPSSVRMEYSGNADRIGFIPKDAAAVPLRVEARVPHYGDTIGTATASYQPAQYAVSARVLGRSGPRPMVWSPAAKGLVPAPEGTFVVDEAIRFKATLTGEPKPDPVRWSWTVNEGTTMRSSGLGDEITVTRSEAGSATATVVAKDKDGRELGSASTSCSFAPNQPPLPLKVLVSAGAKRVRSGDRTGVQAVIQGGAPPYRVDWTGARGSGTTAQFEAGRAGVQTVTVTVSDRAGGSATASTGITIDAVPLAVTIQAESRALQPGDRLPLRVAVREGTPPYRIEWGGAARGSGEAAELVAPASGSAKVTVRATDAWNNIGESTREFPVTAVAIRASVAGVYGEAPVLWDDAARALKPVPAGRYAEGQRVRLAAAMAGGAKPAGADFAWTAASGCRLDGAAKGSAAEVTLGAKGTAEARVALVNAAGVEIATASVLLPVDVSAADLAAAKKKADDWATAQENGRKAKALLEEGYAFEKSGELPQAIAKYKAALALQEDPRIAGHIAELEKKAADLERARKLVEAGYGLEAQGEFAAAVGKYRSSLALHDDPRVRAHMAEVESKAARSARASDWVAKGFAHESGHRWGEALACYEAAQKEVANPKVDERIRYVRSQMELAAAKPVAVASAKEPVATGRMAPPQPATTRPPAIVTKPPAASPPTASKPPPVAVKPPASPSGPATPPAIATKPPAKPAATPSSPPPVVAKPAPAPPSTVPAGPKYNLNGNFSGRIAVAEVNYGHIIYDDVLLTIRQNGYQVSVSIRSGGETVTVTGRIVGDTLKLEEQTLRIVDGGRALIDEAGQRFSR